MDPYSISFLLRKFLLKVSKDIHKLFDRLRLTHSLKGPCDTWKTEYLTINDNKTFLRENNI